MKCACINREKTEHFGPPKMILHKSCGRVIFHPPQVKDIIRRKYEDNIAAYLKNIIILWIIT